LENVVRDIELLSHDIENVKLTRSWVTISFVVWLAIQVHNIIIIIPYN